MQRPVGPGCNSRLSNRVAGQTLPGASPSLPPLLERRDRVSGDGGRENDIQRGDHPSGVWDGERLCLQHFLGSQEGWGPQANNQPEKAELLCPTPSLQDGGNTYAKRPLKARGFYGQDRPEGRLLCGADKRAGQEIPEVQVERSNVSVQLPTFWTVMRSLGLYQDNQGSSSSPEGDGRENYNVHRRYADHGRVGDLAERPCQRSGVPPREPRFRDQLPQIVAGTQESLRVPRLPSRLDVHGTETSRGQDQEHQRGSKEDSGGRPCNGLDTIQSPGEDECGHKGHLYGPSVLSAIASRAATSPKQVLSGLQYPNPPVADGEGGARVVEHPLHKLEWAEPNSQETQRIPRDGRLANRVGSSLSGRQNWRPLVPGGAKPPHQLPRDAGSILGFQMLLQGGEEHSHSVENGQYVGHSLHKQKGRDSVPNPEQTEQGILAVVHGEGHNSTSPAPGRSPELYRGCRIQSNERQIRLDAESKRVSSNQPQTGSTGSGSLCLQTDCPTPLLCELETGPGGNSYGCFHHDLDGPKGICQPAVEPSGKGPLPSSSTEGRSDPGGTSMEGTDVVPNSAGNVQRLSTLNSSGKKSYPTNPSSIDARGGPPTSRVEYLRGRYKDQQLSEKATELMLASWREKSSKAYDSQFQKWIGWCNKRGADPISCPIGEVVNFLADLFSQGYQYRSLNAYRSAISSVHDKVDGYDVGQHPLVSRLLKGVFHQRPPQPRYTQTWDVRAVTSYIRSMGANNSLSLQRLTHKLAMLMALTRPSRSADLANLDLNHRTYSAEGVTFLPTVLSKQSRQRKHGTEFFFPSYSLDDLLCPVLALREYESRTEELRGPHSTLFLGVTKPHKPVCSSTIARWLKTFLGKAGIDTEIFKAHSVRSASTSAAAMAGITTNDILKAADWSSETVFQKFYHKPTASSQFGKAVLSSE